MYWDDSNLIIEPYERKQKRYHCGRKLLKIDKEHKIKYTLLVIDLSEAYCAHIYEDGSYEKIFDITSSVQGKHKKGGQSQRRFDRIREGSITEWYKRLNEYISEVDTKICMAINFIYQSRFESHLSTNNKQKVERWDRPEYGGFTGFMQYKNKIEKEALN